MPVTIVYTIDVCTTRFPISNPLGSIHFYRYTAHEKVKSLAFENGGQYKMGARKQCAQCPTDISRPSGTQQHVPLYTYRTNKAVDDRETYPIYKSDSKSLKTPANIRTETPNT